MKGFKKIEKRRAMESLVTMGGHHAAVSADFANAIRDAQEDKSPLLPIYSRMSFIWGKAFIEICELLAGVPTLVYGMDKWGKTFQDYHGVEWSEHQVAGFNFLISEYLKAADEAGGTDVKNPTLHMEAGEYAITFDERDEDDDD